MTKLRVRPTVRAMMAMVLIVAVFLGWIGHEARTQRLAVEAIRRSGGIARYEWDMDLRKLPKGYPSWFVDIVGSTTSGMLSTSISPVLRSRTSSCCTSAGLAV